MRVSLGPWIVAAALGAACGRAEAPAPSASPAASPPLADAGPGPVPAGTPALPPGHPPVSGEAPTGGGIDAPPGAEGVSGTITLAPDLRGRAAAGDTLFVIARNAGTNEIVAVRREQGVQFPFTFQISGADSMTPGSSFAGPFDITVRLSKSGDAAPAAGDLEGVARGVAAGSNSVEIVLSTVRQ